MICHCSTLASVTAFWTFVLFAAGSAALAGCSNIPTPTGNGDYRNLRVIDAHAHWYPREFVELMEKEGPANGAKMGKDAEGNSVVLSVNGGTQTSVMRRNMIDLELMIKEMDARKVNMYALSMTNPMVYWAPPAFALKLSQAANNAGSAAHLKYPDRFVSTIMLPMQDPKLAVRELERAVKQLGFIGAHLHHLVAFGDADLCLMCSCLRLVLYFLPYQLKHYL